MTTRTLPSLLTISLVLLAGCGSISGAFSPTGTASHPEGVDDTGVTDTFALVDAHASVLAQTSFTVTTEVTTTDGTGAEATTYAQTVVDSESYHVTSADQDGMDEIWSNGTAAYWMRTTGDEKTYQQVRADSGRDLTSYQEFSSLLFMTETTTEGTVERDGETLHKISTTGVTAPAELADSLGVDSIENFSATFLITEDGLIREYTHTYTATTSDSTITRTKTKTFENVGSTDVDTPAWLRTAQEETSR